MRSAELNRRGFRIASPRANFHWQLPACWNYREGGAFEFRQRAGITARGARWNCGGALWRFGLALDGCIALQGRQYLPPVGPVLKFSLGSVARLRQMRPHLAAVRAQSWPFQCCCGRARVDRRFGEQRLLVGCAGLGGPNPAFASQVFPRKFLGDKILKWWQPQAQTGPCSRRVLTPAPPTRSAFRRGPEHAKGPHPVERVDELGYLRAGPGRELATFDGVFGHLREVVTTCTSFTFSWPAPGRPPSPTRSRVELRLSVPAFYEEVRVEVPPFDSFVTSSR